MRVIVTGCSGQLGWELQQTSSNKHDVIYLTSKDLDVTNTQDILALFLAQHPDLVINAAAYTAVDKAESEEVKAYAVNELGVKHLATACKEVGAKLIHISTDFVFDGAKNTPYLPSDQTNPVSIYGASKLAGEQHVHNLLANDAAIVRTAWVYSQHGNNFVKTMLRLMKEKDQLGVVYDQVGTPTWAQGLAEMVWALADKMHKEEKSKQHNQAAIYHWTDAGVASWYDFAVAIQDIAFEKGLLEKKIPIRPIPASAYPTPAKRPSYSVLDKASAEGYSGKTTEYWRVSLEKMLSSFA
jgi:dTDP-4-dehydrorhamnose reductase